MILAAMAVPQLMAGADRSRTYAAARFLATRMALARVQAVTRGATVGCQFTGEGASVAFTMYVDGNDDGVRTRDIATGIDGPIETPTRLDESFPGVTFQLDNGSGGAVQFGAGRILSFTPAGTATSGSAYVRGRDGSQYAVRVLGATARTRVLRYDPQRQEFLEVP